jgi:hypothetical protein
MTTDILLIAGPQDSDEELVAAAAAADPLRVTILIDQDDPTWSWNETPDAAARRDRLAALLTATEIATGAAVVGTIGDPVQLQLAAYDFVVGGREILTAA